MENLFPLGNKKDLLSLVSFMKAGHHKSRELSKHVQCLQTSFFAFLIGMVTINLFLIVKFQKIKE